MFTKNNTRLILILLFFLLYNPAGSFSQTIQLDEFIQAVLLNNPAVKSAADESALSVNDINMARSQRAMSVYLEGAGGLSDELHVGNNYKYLYSRLSAEQLLWQNRKVDASIQQARFNALASLSTFEAIKQETVLTVKTAYYNCQQQYQLYQIARDNVARSALMLEYARDRSNLGIGRKSDVLKAESDLSQAVYEQNSYYNSFRKSKNDLSMLTGIVPGEDWEPDSIGQADSTIYSGKLTDSLVSMAVSGFPELQAAINRGLSQQEKIKVTQAAFYPCISFNSGYEWSYNPALSEQKNWSALLTLRWSLFSGKENHYRLRSDQIRKESLSDQAEDIRLNLIRDISNQLISMNEAQQQIRLFKSLKKTTNENLEIAKAQYKAGTGSMLELTDARITDLMANQNYIQALTKFQMSVANLERLTGKTNENQ